MVVIIQHKKDEEGAVWEKLAVPDLLSERMALMSKLAGTQTIITIASDRMVCYLCGTEGIRIEKQKQMEERGLTRVCMKLKDAHTQLELDPMTFVYCLQIFSTEEDKVTLMPPTPVLSKGWEHLKEKQMNEKKQKLEKEKCNSNNTEISSEPVPAVKE